LVTGGAWGPADLQRAPRWRSAAVARSRSTGPARVPAAGVGP